jgi:hypothetical protein
VQLEKYSFGIGDRFGREGKAQLQGFLAAAVSDWNCDDFVDAVRHNLSCSRYNANVRQLLHLAYKIAAEMGTEFTDALEQYNEYIS